MMRPYFILFSATFLFITIVGSSLEAEAQSIDYPQTRNFIEAFGSQPNSVEILERNAAPVRLMRHTLKMDRPFLLWNDRFCQTEQSTALRFGELIYGKTRAQVKKLIGAPDVQSKSKSLSSPVDSDDWLYILGRTPVLMRLIFDRDKCIQLNVQPYDLDGPYCAWRKRDLLSSAIGKTSREVLEAQGPPREASDLSLPPGLSNRAQIDFWLNALKAETFWTYKLGDGNDVTLAFKDGKCRGQVNPDNLAPAYTEERTSGAAFKMPPRK